MTLANELDLLLQEAQDKLPCNPLSTKNLKLADDFEKDMRGYFKALSDGFPYKALNRLYNKYAEFTEVMTPADWKAEYKKGIPHWAKDLEPSQFAEEFVDLMKAHKIKSVLEVGCGNGRDSILFAKSGLDVTSIDIVPKAIELATNNAKKLKAEITFKVASVEKLPFEDAGFGAVFTLSVLHSTNLKKSLPEVYRVLTDGGVAFIYIYGDTQFKNGKKTEDTVAWKDYLKQLKTLGFKVLDSYINNEKEYDKFGEKHHIFVVLLEKVGE